MSVRARPASAEPAAKFHSGDNKTRTLQQSLQLTESHNGKEQRGWITEAEWTIYVKEDPNDNFRSQSVVSIFRVPHFLKRSKREAYVPISVSLGPYHHRSAEIPLMSNHKGRALRIMRTRNFMKANEFLANYSNKMDFSDRARVEIAKLEKQIRESYAEEIDCDGNTLVMMQTLDGCFIVEILRTLFRDKLSKSRERKIYDPIFGVSTIEFTGNDIQNDILKLENQIPLIVLLKLLEVESNFVNNGRSHLLLIVTNLCSKFYPSRNKVRWPWPQEEVHHILGLLHAFVVRPPDHHDHSDTVSSSVWINLIKWSSAQINCIKCNLNSAWSKCIQGNSRCFNLIKCIGEWSKCSRGWCSKQRTVNDVRRIYRARELKNAGIKFKECAGSIRMIKFDRNTATIFLPPTTITDLTEDFFRNLIAYEICKPAEINYVTSYVSLMDELVDSEDDVAVLRRSGIITNYLGSDAEVAQVFNNLFKDVTESREDAFEDLKREVHVHYTDKINVHLALFRKEYLSSPWKAVAWVGAMLIVFLTTVQTIYTVLSFYKGP